MKGKLPSPLIGIGLTIGCVVLGIGAMPYILRVFWFKPFYQGVAIVCVAVVLGSILSFFSAYVLPKVWVLWPLLFGLPMFLFGMGANFSQPNPRGLILWKTMAAVFLVLPLCSAYFGRQQKLAQKTLKEIE